VIFWQHFNKSNFKNHASIVRDTRNGIHVCLVAERKPSTLLIVLGFDSNTEASDAVSNIRQWTCFRPTINFVVLLTFNNLKCRDERKEPSSDMDRDACLQCGAHFGTYFL
jgi:hypothetical protein